MVLFSLLVLVRHAPQTSCIKSMLLQKRGKLQMERRTTAQCSRMGTLPVHTCRGQRSPAPVPECTGASPRLVVFTPRTLGAVVPSFVPRTPRTHSKVKVRSCRNLTYSPVRGDSFMLVWQARHQFVRGPRKEPRRCSCAEQTILETLLQWMNKGGGLQCWLALNPEDTRVLLVSSL